MNLRLLFLLIVLVTAKLALADDGVTVRIPVRLGPGLAPRPSAPSTMEPVTLAPRQLVTQAPAPRPPVSTQEPVSVPPRQPLTQQTETAPEIPEIPKCNPRDLYNPKYSTDNIKEIDHALLTVTGYEHAFNANWQLNEDPVSGFNQCHTAIRKLQVAQGVYVPQIRVEGCAAAMALPARACQSGNTIKFLVANSDAGMLSKLPSRLEVSFSRSNLYENHWMVIGQGHEAHLKEAPVTSASMR